MRKNMNTNAYDILREKRLPSPDIYTLDTIENISLEKQYYLRYNNELSGIKSHVLSGNEIAKNRHVIESHLKDKILLQIEDVISTIAGGALYVYDGIVYGEYCEGHPIVLLRRGICGRRFILIEGKKSFVLPALQNWIAEQKDTRGEYEWKPFNGIMSSNFMRIINFIKKINFFEHGLLLEYLMEKEEIIFCDAKNKDFGISPSAWTNIFTNSEMFIQIKGIAKITKQMKIDMFDIDNRGNCPLEDICVYNGAMLSHYVTYNINKITNVFFLKT
jgi:hypothetical protein